jgi:hypothetical protein
MYDTILIGVAAFLNLALTFMGLYVAVRPVPEGEEKRKRRILFGCFGACALALFVAVYVAARATEAQTTLQNTVEKVLGTLSTVQTEVNSLPAGNSAPPATEPRPQPARPPLPNGFLQFKQVQYVTGDEFFTLGKPLQLNVYYINKGQAPVSDAFVSAALALAVRGNHPQQAIDAEVLNGFEPKARAQTDKGSPLGVDTLLWTTPSLPAPLTAQMVDGIMGNQFVLYVVSYARWTDSYGKPNSVLDCVWLNPPPNEHPALSSLVWQECAR